ncbi:stress response translation initiation inhibitor YciH [Candidatus Micrarchaeota archaeon]|nr:stress response translation initiation inhibitor YciH [Candidatus Micrarchaeota archaeon]
MDRDPITGLPRDLGMADVLDKEGATKIKVYTTKKKFKKLVTIVEGIDKSQLQQTTKELKQKLACGGTFKEGVVILQGDHKNKLKNILVKLGYPEDNIQIS